MLEFYMLSLSDLCHAAEFFCNCSYFSNQIVRFNSNVKMIMFGISFIYTKVKVKRYIIQKLVTITLELFGENTIFIINFLCPMYLLLCVQFAVNGNVDGKPKRNL